MKKLLECEDCLSEIYNWVTHMFFLVMCYCICSCVCNNLICYHNVCVFNFSIGFSELLHNI